MSASPLIPKSLSPKLAKLKELSERVEAERAEWYRSGSPFIWLAVTNETQAFEIAAIAYVRELIAKETP